MCPAEALRDGLEQALLACQACAYNQSDYAPQPVLQLPESLRGDHSQPLETSEPSVRPPVADQRSIVDALHQLGWIPVVVPLNHDPEMSQIMPYVVNVVLVDE